MITEHAYRYRWMQSAHNGRKDIPLSLLKDRIAELCAKDLKKELEQLQNFEDCARKRKRELLKQKPVDENTLRLIDIADAIAPIHDRRKELFMRTIYTTDTIREEIGKKIWIHKRGALCV